LPDNWPKSLKRKSKTKKENKKSSSSWWEIKSSKIKSLNLKVFQNSPDFSSKKSMGDTPLVSEPSSSLTESKKLPKKLWKTHSSLRIFFWELSLFSETNSDKTRNTHSEQFWSNSASRQSLSNLMPQWNSKEKFWWD